MTNYRSQCYGIIVIMEDQLPKSLLNYISNDSYDAGSIPVDISATRLKDTPRISRLFKQHRDKIKINHLDKGFAKLGEAWHKAMEDSSPDDWICEKRFYADVNGYVISGAIDGLEPVGKNLYNIWDYKLMSSYKAKTDLSEFVKQLNIYAYILKKNNINVKNLYISAMIRDWTVNRISDPNYPQTNLPVFKLEKWDDKVTEQYVMERVEHHTQEELPECTDEEMWSTGDTFIVESLKAGKVMKVFKTKEEAELHPSVIKGTAKVDKRSSERLRCKRYCEVADFCDQYQQHLTSA